MKTTVEVQKGWYEGSQATETFVSGEDGVTRIEQRTNGAVVRWGHSRWRLYPWNVVLSYEEEADPVTIVQATPMRVAGAPDPKPVTQIAIPSTKGRRR